MPVAQIFINFIAENQLILINAPCNYQYWVFEVKMLKEKNSYRSYMPDVCQHLTCSETINILLIDVKRSIFTLPQHLFHFLEHSDSMKGKKPLPTANVSLEHEIQTFVKLG